MNIKLNENVSKNNTISLVIRTSSIVNEEDVVDQNRIGMSYPILMKLLSTKKIRQDVQWIWYLQWWQWRWWLFFNGAINNCRSSVLRDPSSDNSIFQHNDFDEFFATINDPDELPNIAEEYNDCFNLHPITSTD